MKVAIVYDRVNKFGGAERVLLALHKIFPKAPLYTSVYDPKRAVWAKKFPKVHTSFLQQIPFAKNNHELFPLFMPFAFSRFNFNNYDLVISVTSEFAKNINTKGVHICYCLTPTRYLWSHEDEYFKNKFLKRLLYPFISYLKYMDKRASRKPNIMIAISTEVQKRIKKYYNREPQIIFPPVELKDSKKKKLINPTTKTGSKDFQFLREKRYYLLVSRLVSYKKVDLAIRAFNKLNLPLVIIGTGREEKKLTKIANKNVYFIGNVSDNELVHYYKNAKALIFPQEEDFGIVAAEAGMFGLPVIAYKGGGANDIVTNKSGIFFKKQNEESLIKAIKNFQKRKFDKREIKKNASRFSRKRFQKEILQLVKNL